MLETFIWLKVICLKYTSLKWAMFTNALTLRNDALARDASSDDEMLSAQTDEKFICVHMSVEMNADEHDAARDAEHDAEWVSSEKKEMCLRRSSY